jgi:hypothetical protein
MKTSDLVAVLAQGAGAAPRALAARRLVPAALVGVVASAALALAVIGLVPVELFADARMGVKIGYAAAMATAAGWLAARLGRPAAPSVAPLRSVLVVLAVMVALGVVALIAAPSGGRAEALFGHSWQRCPVNVLALSLPALAAALWALRGLAPTRPRAAGAAAGLLAGAIGALGYALSCDELSPAFVAVWYTLGIALAGALGAMLGPRVLRW